MKNDPLKDLFNETFANEEIVFNEAAWQAMNGLLNKSHYRRFMWIAISGTFSFGAVCLLVMLLFNSSSKIYQPRKNAFQFSSALSAENNISDAKTGTSVPELVSAENIAFSTLSTVKNERSEPITKTHSTLSKPEEQSGKTHSETGLKTTEGQAVTTLQTESLPYGQLNSNPLEDDIAFEEQRIALEKLDKMKTKSWDTAAFSPEARPALPPYLLNYESGFYIRIGASRNFMLGTGQIGGLGYQKQIADHLFLNAEIIAARDYTYFNLIQEQVIYGFDQYNSALRIWASEMIHVESPLLVRFRHNRISGATGLSLGLVWTSKVIEETLLMDDVIAEQKQPIGNQTELGYVNWGELRTLQLALPLDVQYQLDERYFIGTRLQLGLRDAFIITPEMDRLNRFEFYFKMNLNQ